MTADSETFEASAALEIAGAPVGAEAMAGMRRAIAATVKRLVAAEAGVTVKQLTSPSRQAKVAHARQLAMYLTRMYSYYSTPQIGRFFGDRDHTTVLWALARVQGRLRSDQGYARRVGSLHEKIAQETGLRPCGVETTRSLEKKVARLKVTVIADAPEVAGITN